VHYSLVFKNKKKGNTPHGICIAQTNGAVCELSSSIIWWATANFIFGIWCTCKKQGCPNIKKAATSKCIA
jgi:hypothetical protein